MMKAVFPFLFLAISLNIGAAVKLQDLKYSCQVDLLGQTNEVKERIIIHLTQQDCKKSEKNILECSYFKRVKGFKNKALEIGVVLNSENDLFSDSKSYTYLKFDNEITVKTPITQPDDEIGGLKVYNEIRPEASSLNLKKEKIQFVKCDLVSSFDK